MLIHTLLKLSLHGAGLILLTSNMVLGQTPIQTFEVTNGDTAFFTVQTRATLMDGDTLDRLDAHDIPQGYWEHEFADGSYKCGGYYKDGRKDGYWVKHFPNGSLRYQINLKNGYVHGKCKFYYPNGQLREEGAFKAGLEHGMFKTYDQRGRLRKVEQFRFGRSHGAVEHYNASGKLKVRGNTRRGMRNGDWYFIEEDDLSLLYVIYKNDKTLSFTPRTK